MEILKSLEGESQLKIVEPIRDTRLLSVTKSSGVSGTDLINSGRMKG